MHHALVMRSRWYVPWLSALFLLGPMVSCATPNEGCRVSLALGAPVYEGTRVVA